MRCTGKIIGRDAKANWSPHDAGIGADQFHADAICSQWRSIFCQGRGLDSVGRVLAASESAIVGVGFSQNELVATLAGESLYLACGYSEVERYEVAMKDGFKLPVVRMTKVKLKH